jgi:2-keto-3-deoxy-L-rhamnonate aldolase RhmA
MRANRAKEVLGRGECVYGTSLEYCLDPEIPILLAKAGFDLFFIDTEHTTADITTSALSAGPRAISELLRWSG